jgi:predicted RNA polymerase sigma factor
MPSRRSPAYRLPYVRSPALITLICAHGRRRLQAQLAVHSGGYLRTAPGPPLVAERDPISEEARSANQRALALAVNPAERELLIGRLSL